MESPPLRHTIRQVAVYADSLSVSGDIEPVNAFTDYGIKVFNAVDDRGTRLELKSFQISLRKGYYFEIELTKPDLKAKTVTLDIAFTSRSGLQRIKATQPIERSNISNFYIRFPRFDRKPSINSCPPPSKKSGGFQPCTRLIGLSPFFPAGMNVNA
jgi:hypothetical protein